MNDAPHRAPSERTALAAIWLVGGRLLARSIDLLSLLVLARLLDPSQFGTVAMAMTLIYIVEALVEMPLNQTLVRLPQITPSLLDTAFTLGLIRGVIIATALVVLAYPYALFNGEQDLVPLICVLGLAPAVRGLASPAMVAFARAIDFRRDFILDVLGKLGTLLVATIVAYRTHSYWALAAGTVASPCVTTIASYYFAPYRPRLTLSEWPSFAHMVRWNALTQLVGAINWQIDRFLLGRFASKDELGRFSVSNDVAAIPYQALVLPILRPLVAGFSSIPEGSARLGAAYNKATAAVMMVGTPILFGMAVLSEPIVRLILGPKWDQAPPVLTLLALSGVAPLVAAPFGSLAMRLGRFHLLTVQSLIEFSIKIPAMLIGIYFYGLWGVLIARIVCGFSTAISSMLLVRHLIKLPFVKQLIAPWKPLLSASVMALCLLPLLPYLNDLSTGPERGLGLATVVAAGAFVYAVTLLLLWQLSGRPHGAEEIIYRNLKSGLKLVRARFA